MHYELIDEHLYLKEKKHMTLDATNRDEAVEEAMAYCTKFGRNTAEIEVVEISDGKCVAAWAFGYWA